MMRSKNPASSQHLGRRRGNDLESSGVKKNIVAIFAHPDDEAFGPAGTLIEFAKTYDVYILCATCGEEGLPSGASAQIRAKELENSAKILGVKKVYFLGFRDGTLSNALYHKLAQKIESKLNLLKPKTLITFEPRGISGHIDHITVSMVTSYIFYKLPFIKTLLYYCISEAERKLIKDYFIYFPPGYKKDEIDKVVDISKQWSQKVQAMMTHQSQVKDAQRILEIRKHLPKKEYFIVLKK